jgi:hypothetical protein
MNLIPEDKPWTDALELGALAGIFDQDMANLPYVQDGLKASKTGEVNLGDYQEIRVRHFHGLWTSTSPAASRRLNSPSSRTARQR